VPHGAGAVTLGTLALIVAVGLAGPLLAWSERLRIPVVVGELAAGVLVGRTGLQLVDSTGPTFSFLADVGFAMLMFIAGTHVPIRDRSLLTGLPRAVLRLVVVAAAAAGLGAVVGRAFGTDHSLLYAVLLASSSAAIILPVVDAQQLAGPAVLQLLPQVAIADAACIVALPLVIDPTHAGRAAIGAVVMLVAAGAAFLLLWFAERQGWRVVAHRKSERRGFALELRISVLMLLLLAALAQQVHVSIMLAGFSLGLAVAAIGPPRRLARQLFGVSEGLFAPLFFIWLGASLDLRELGQHPSMIVLGVVLAAAAVSAHMTAALTGAPVSMTVLSAAQLGVPVSAATLGTQLQLLRPGEAAALLLGALLTIAAATIAGRASSSTPTTSPASPASSPSPETNHRPGADARTGNGQIE